MARVFLLVALVLAVAIALVGCGAKTTHYTLAKTSTCLRAAGARLGGQLDFVATTATGGGTRVHLTDNALTLVFGLTDDDADKIDAAYRRFHAVNVGIDDVLRQQANAIMLWQAHPGPADLTLVTGCLK